MHKKTKKEVVINYIKKNPNATYSQIKKDTKLKIERIFPRGMKEAYKIAQIPFSKALSKRSREEQTKEVINFIKINPKCTVTEVQNATKVSIPKVFGSIIYAYKIAGIEYPKLSKLIKAYELIRNNPLLTSIEIQKNCGINVYKKFGNMKEFYKKANVKYITGSKKESFKIKNKIIEYIKSHPNCTQWEINKNCNTHVQEIFKGGITTAYKKARLKYPKERRINYGAMQKSVKKRALEYEYDVINILSKIGHVERYFKTKSGIADALFKLKNKLYIVEIKCYSSKSVSLSDVKQLNKYINCVDNCNNGLLICKNIGKKDKFYIDGNEIHLLTEKELLNGDVA